MNELTAVHVDPNHAPSAFDLNHVNTMLLGRSNDGLEVGVRHDTYGKGSNFLQGRGIQSLGGREIPDDAVKVSTSAYETRGGPRRRRRAT